MTPRLNDAAEERLRPSRYLGYDRDRIGLHLLSKEMFDIAESQFRRAAYLNPFEAGFPQHLAWALFQQGKLEEAKRAIEASLNLKPDDFDSQHIARRIEAELHRAGASDHG